MANPAILYLLDEDLTDPTSVGRPIELQQVVEPAPELRAALVAGPFAEDELIEELDRDTIQLVWWPHEHRGNDLVGAPPPDYSTAEVQWVYKLPADRPLADPLPVMTSISINAPLATKYNGPHISISGISIDSKHSVEVDAGSALGVVEALDETMTTGHIRGWNVASQADAARAKESLARYTRLQLWLADVGMRGAGHGRTQYVRTEDVAALVSTDSRDPAPPKRWIEGALTAGAESTPADLPRPTLTDPVRGLPIYPFGTAERTHYLFRMIVEGGGAVEIDGARIMRVSEHDKLVRALDRAAAEREDLERAVVGQKERISALQSQLDAMESDAVVRSETEDRVRSIVDRGEFVDEEHVFGSQTMQAFVQWREGARRRAAGRPLDGLILETTTAEPESERSVAGGKRSAPLRWYVDPAPLAHTDYVDRDTGQPMLSLVHDTALIARLDRLRGVNHEFDSGAFFERVRARTADAIGATEVCDMVSALYGLDDDDRRKLAEHLIGDPGFQADIVELWRRETTR